MLADAPRPLPAAAVLPALPPRVPRSAYPRWARWLGRLVMRTGGWRYTGGFADAPNQVLVGAPHTSNWDGIMALGAAAVCGVGVRVFVKRELFRGPVAAMLRVFGGVPVDRSAPGGLVGRAVEVLRAPEPAFVVVTPEGTRGPVERWRTGFHRMAVEAGAPICVLALDYGRREVGVRGTFVPSGDLDADLDAIAALLDTVEARHPEHATPPTAGR